MKVFPLAKEKALGVKEIEISRLIVQSPTEHLEKVNWANLLCRANT